MTTFSGIANSEIAVGAPITNSLMTKNRDNPLAIQENDVSAPTNAYATLAATITSQGALATLDSVASAQIDADSVGRSELKTTTVSLSGSLPTNSHVGITLDAYAFFPMIHNGGAADPAGVFLTGHATDGASADNPRFTFYNGDLDDTGTYDVDYRYITA